MNEITKYLLQKQAKNKLQQKIISFKKGNNINRIKLKTLVNS